MAVSQDMQSPPTQAAYWTSIQDSASIYWNVCGQETADWIVGVTHVGGILFNDILSSISTSTPDKLVMTALSHSNDTEFNDIHLPQQDGRLGCLSCCVNIRSEE